MGTSLFILISDIIFLTMIAMKFVHARHIQDFEGFSESATCGHLREGRVIGGDEAVVGEFPWITSVQSKAGNHFCAGFIINKRFVVSASHCFVKRYNSLLDYKEDGSVDVESVRVAVNRVKLSDDASDPSKLMKVKRLIMHPEFEEVGLNNDIAILELKQDMEWENDMYPICLPESSEDDDTETGVAVVAGWGYRHCNSITPSNELHKIDVPIWKADDCKKSYNDAEYDFTRKDYVCAGSDKKDISKGDSGGALMILNKDKRYTAIGIVSSGRFMCSDRVPGVYTKVQSYLTWIKSQAQM